MGNELEYKWKDIYIWGENNQAQRVDTIEQALKQGDLGCYVICDTDDYFATGYGYSLEEALVNTINNSTLQEAETPLDHHKVVELYEVLPKVKGADLCLYPASEQLISKVEHYCSVQCKFTGKMAERLDNSSLQRFIARFKQLIQSYNLKYPIISVYVPENEKDPKLYYPMKHVREYLPFIKDQEELYVLEKELATQTKIFIKLTDKKHVLLFEFVLVCSSGNNLFNSEVLELGNVHYIKNNLIRYEALDFINEIFFSEEFSKHYYTSLAPELLNSFSSDNFYFLHPVK